MSSSLNLCSLNPYFLATCSVSDLVVDWQASPHGAYSPFLFNFPYQSEECLMMLCIFKQFKVSKRVFLETIFCYNKLNCKEECEKNSVES